VRTRGPWYEIGVNIQSCKSNSLCYNIGSMEYEEDAKRVVLCINKCAKLTNEELEEDIIENALDCRLYCVINGIDV